MLMVTCLSIWGWYEDILKQLFAADGFALINVCINLKFNWGSDGSFFNKNPKLLVLYAAILNTAPFIWNNSDLF